MARDLGRALAAMGQGLAGRGRLGGPLCGWFLTGAMRWPSLATSASVWDVDRGLRERRGPGGSGFARSARGRRMWYCLGYWRWPRGPSRKSCSQVGALANVRPGCFSEGLEVLALF